MRKWLTGLIILWMASDGLCVDIKWYNDHQITYESGGTNYLIGSPGDSNVGCYAQLIYTGADGTNNPASDSGNGATGDDQVADKRWFGAGVFDPDPNGWFNPNNGASGITNGWYYVRSWSAPSPDYGGGLIPGSHTNRYADSALWQFVVHTPLQPDDGYFDFGGDSGYSTTLIPGADSNANGIPDWWEFLYFHNITGAVASVDTDVDGIDNLGEYLSGTVPTNSLSVLSVDDIQPVGGNAIVVKWSSVTGKVYSVERGVSATNTFSTLASNITAATVNTYTDVADHVQFYLYRVRLQQ